MNRNKKRRVDKKGANYVKKLCEVVVVDIRETDIKKLNLQFQNYRLKL